MIFNKDLRQPILNVEVHHLALATTFSINKRLFSKIIILSVRLLKLLSKYNTKYMLSNFYVVGFILMIKTQKNMSFSVCYQQHVSFEEFIVASILRSNYFLDGR